MIEDETGFGLFDLADPTPDAVPSQPLFESDEAVVNQIEQAENEDIVEGGGLFGPNESFHAVWREWQGMPEFASEDMMPWYQVIVNFAEPEDLEAFSKLVDFPLNATARRTTSMWYPPQMKFGPSAIDKRYRDPKDEQYWRRQPRNFRKDSDIGRAAAPLRKVSKS